MLLLLIILYTTKLANASDSERSPSLVLLPPCLLEVRGTKCPDRRWLGLPVWGDRQCLGQSRLFELCSRLEWNGVGGIGVAGAV